MALPILDFIPQTLVKGRKPFCTPLCCLPGHKIPFFLLKDT